MPLYLYKYPEFIPFEGGRHPLALVVNIGNHDLMLKAILFDLDDTLLDWSGFNGDWKTLECQFLKGVFDYVGTASTPLPDSDAFIEEFHFRIL